MLRNLECSGSYDSILVSGSYGTIFTPHFQIQALSNPMLMNQAMYRRLEAIKADRATPFCVGELTGSLNPEPEAALTLLEKLITEELGS